MVGKVHKVCFNDIDLSRVQSIPSLQLHLEMNAGCLLQSILRPPDYTRPDVCIFNAVLNMSANRIHSIGTKSVRRAHDRFPASQGTPDVNY